jgi:hypothetical protein
MGLRARTWRRFLNAPDPELVAELYEPALRQAARYDRCCAYFSSSVLAAAARGFGPLVERLLAAHGAPTIPPIRLLVNEELSRDDVDAMLFAHGADALAERLSKRLLEPQDAIEQERLALLGLLVKRGLLEVRVGVMRSGHGILHAKFGIITDADGDAVVFNGSGNESASGLVANFESLEVTCSWGDTERYAHFCSLFETLWAGDSAQVAVVALPEAVRDRLIRYSEADAGPAQPPPMNRRKRLEASMHWRFALEAPWFIDGGNNCDAMAPGGVLLWPHQVRVVEECAAAWPAGRLLCDEVGMGKTIEAIMIVRRLLAGRGVRRALFMVPAGIVQQWQGELREKGGLLVPRLEGQTTLIWPDGLVEQRGDLAAVMCEPLLLVSREMLRLEQNASVLLESPRWDLVLLDEAHAARRASQEENEFNSATLLLALMRNLQLLGRARGLLLLSATPMQTHPWEPWDLLGVLGEGAPWLAAFATVRAYYTAIEGAEDRPVSRDRGQTIAAIVKADPAFPALPVTPGELPARLLAAPSEERRDLVGRLRLGAPLGRRMHRNTRKTLQAYFDMGYLERPPAKRLIQDVQYDFDQQPDQRDVYDGVQTYVERRFQELEWERPGKGFVMTVYRRRAASSPMALRRSLERRRHGLELVARGAAADQVEEVEASDEQDLDEFLGSVAGARLPSSLPDDPVVARQELREVERLQHLLAALQGRDAKLDKFAEALQLATDDGRACLVFSEFTDTVEYLRDALLPRYGDALACYTGRGGEVREAGKWRTVSKKEITSRLGRRDLRVLLCSDAASEGLNLQVASALINYDLPWNPARVEQRIGRVDRIGQHATDIRIVNLVLKNSVDERVYQVLGQRCDLFQTFVGAMQPVLSVARRMLLGVLPFDAAALDAEVAKAKADTVTDAAFRSNQAPPPIEKAPGVTIDDMARAWSQMGKPFKIATPRGTKELGVRWTDLEADACLVPLSPFTSILRGSGVNLDDSGELLPLVVEVVEEGAFRASGAVWVGADEVEVVERAERLEALLGMWDGSSITESQWRSAHADLRTLLTAAVASMREHAAREERMALERQVATARQRLLAVLARFLACAIENDDEAFNSAFHRWMQRGGQTAALLARAHALVGYPEWTAGDMQTAANAVAELTPNQRTNVLLGTPLAAAVVDPRWGARETLLHLSAGVASAVTGVAIGASGGGRSE